MLLPKSKKKTFFTKHRTYILIITALIAIIVYSSYSILKYYQVSETAPPVQLSEGCYINDNLIRDYRLLDVLEGEKPPTAGKTIFFLETSCRKDGNIHLNPRQACAIESAAKHNKLSDIFVLFATPVQLNPYNVTPVVQALLSYPNINFRNVDLWNFVKNTPIDRWFHEGHIFKSNYMNIHISDLLRVLTLYKFGGTYMDLDVVVQKSFEALEPNYAGRESEELVANGLVNLEATGAGHKIAEMCLKDFMSNYDGTRWNYNGPGVITRVLKAICRTQSVVEMTREKCGAFNVYNPEVFYAIHYDYWRHFFEESKLESVMNKTRNSLSVHLWNKLSEDRQMRVGAKVAYGIIAEEHCPVVYSSCGEYF